MTQTGLLSKQIILVTGLFCLCMSQTVKTEESQQDRIRHMIRHDCGACHGYTLKGGLGPSLTSDALKNKSPDALFAIIMQGIDGTPMPPWKNILKPQEVSMIVEQLKTGLPDE